MESYIKKNINISLCRSVATIMIVICHFGTAYGFSSIGQFFQSGVQVFLLISGILYGEKRINAIWEWLLNRWKRVSVPCYIHTVFVSIIGLMIGVPISFMGMLEIFLNLEGYHHIFTWFQNLWIVNGTAHFWFVTVIAACYLLVGVIKGLKLDAVIQEHKLLIIIMLIVFSFCTGLVGLRIDYYVIFFVGYILAYFFKGNVTNKQLFISGVSFVVAVTLRIVGKKYCDVNGDNNLYLYVIIPLSYNTIAIAVYSYVCRIGEILGKTHLGQAIMYEKSMILFDSLTFYIFITHYMLIDGPISLVNITQSRPVNVILVIIGTFACSILLKNITDYLLSNS